MQPRQLHPAAAQAAAEVGRILAKGGAKSEDAALKKTTKAPVGAFGWGRGLPASEGVDRLLLLGNFGQLLADFSQPLAFGLDHGFRGTGNETLIAQLALDARLFFH